MNQQKKNQIYIERVQPIYWYLLASIPATLYLSFVWLNAINAPLSDDFYDTLFVLLRHHSSESLGTDLAWLLWQYHQHFNIYDRLVYWLSTFFSDTVNFYHFTWIGNLGLVTYFLLLTSTLQRKQLFILPCVSVVFFNLYFEEIAFWSMGSLQQLTIMAFTLATLLLLDTGRSILAACAICWLAAFTQSNEILLIPLGFIILLDNVRQKKQPLLNSTLFIWSVSNLLCLALFYLHQNISAFDQFFVKNSSYHAANPIRDIIINFLASLMGLPFGQGSNPLYAAPLGALHFFLIIFFLWRGWQHNRALTLMLLFCSLSLLAASITRTPHSGPTAYVARYKIFTTSIICLEMILASKIFPIGRWVPAIAILATITGGYSYYMNGSYVAYRRQFKEQQIMHWLASGRIQSLALADAILDESYVTALYDPVRDIPQYPALPIAIEATNRCPDINTPPMMTSKLNLVSAPNSRAVLLTANMRSAPPLFTLWLCGKANYRVTLKPPTNRKQQWTELAIIEKRQVSPDKYHLLLEESGKIQDSNLVINTDFQSQISEDCTKHKDAIQALVPALWNYYCTHGSLPSSGALPTTK